MPTSPRFDDRHTRRRRLDLAGLASGIVVVIASWMIGVRRMRDAAVELAGEMPAFVNILVDHGGMITTVAVLVAAAGIVVVELARSGVVRTVVGLIACLMLFLLFIWDVVVFWLIYVATADGIG